MSPQTVATAEVATVGVDAGELAAFAPLQSGRTWRNALERPLVACALLLVVYIALSIALNDPRGTLGTDTGGKLATLHVMAERETLDPDVGYWAESRDPTGTLHPLFYTYRVGDHWVNVTTLPMLDAAYPLFAVGGERGILLLPELGAVLVALAARSLARMLGAGTGMTAFWAIGLATPVAIYALDFWEHSLGLALMLWGVVLLFDVAEARAGRWGAFGAGALFGAAATMRTEALVYLAVSAAVTCVCIAVRRRAIVASVTAGAVVAVGAVAVLVLNQVLEQLVLGDALRSNRVGGAAASAADTFGVRGREALTTLVGLNGFATPLDWIVGGLAALLVSCGAWRLVRHRGGFDLVGIAALVVAGLLLLTRAQVGLGFAPGLLIASPLAAAGVALGWKGRARFLTVIACGSLPLVWMFQYTGGAGPQWGGRYVLLSGALLAIVAVVELRHRRVALGAVLLLAVGVTVFGGAWLSVRSHTIADGMETLVARHDQAVISLEGHVLREGGAFYDPDRHWLTAPNQEDLPRAARIVRDVGDTELAVVALADVVLPRRLAGLTIADRDSLEVRPGEVLRVVTYRDSGSP